MGILDVFKKKNQESSFQFPSEQDLELPPPPPSTDDLGMQELPNIEPESSLPDSNDLPDFDTDHAFPEQDTAQVDSSLFPEMPNLEHSSDENEEVEVQLPAQVPARENIAVNSTTISNNLFMVIGDYKEILAKHNNAKSSLKTLNDSLNNINSIRTEEDREFAKWHSQASDILRKLTYVDKVLFEKSIEN